MGQIEAAEVGAVAAAVQVDVQERRRRNAAHRSHVLFPAGVASVFNGPDHERASPRRLQLRFIWRVYSSISGLCLLFVARRCVTPVRADGSILTSGAVDGIVASFWKCVILWSGEEYNSME